MKDLSQEIAKWDRLAETWAETSPPAVPSGDDIECFRSRLLRVCNDGRGCVVLLGSTLGIRRLFIEEPRLSTVELHCVDWSRKMYDRMTEVGKINNPHEIYHCEDWLSFQLHGHPTRAIIGDKVIDNVPFDRWPRLFNNFYRLLQPNGVLILHLGLVTGEFESVSFEESLRKWAGLVDSGTISGQDAASGLWEDLLTGSAFLGNHSSHVLSVSKFEHEIEEFRQTSEGCSSLTMVEVFERFVASFGASIADEWTAFTLEDIEKAIGDMFAIREIEYSQDYPAATSQPIIELVRLD